MSNSEAWGKHSHADESHEKIIAVMSQQVGMKFTIWEVVEAD